ncbi:MAG TPA: V-type ATP synthase subunit E [Candidatus Eubacterium pullicola]|nr:V-type ATP synthase subunit E [Candidatus Eubacterium pullicola]
MRGIEKIAAQIIGEAEEKKAAIYEEIQHKIDELNAKTDEEIKAELERINDDTLREEGTLEELAGLAAQQKRRQAALSAKQEVIGEIINEAYERLLNLEDEKYFAVIKKMLEDNVLSEKGEIIFSARDRQRMPKDFEDVIKNVALEKGGELVMSDEIRSIDGGFVLVYGGIEENCTFKAMLEASREELHDMVNGKLFG